VSLRKKRVVEDNKEVRKYVNGYLDKREIKISEVEASLTALVSLKEGEKTTHLKRSFFLFSKTQVLELGELTRLRLISLSRAQVKSLN